MGKFIFSAFADEIDPMLSVQMDELDRYGIKYIEMRGVNGKNLVQHSLEEVKEIKKQLDERGFKVSAVGSPIGKIKITDDFGPHLDLFRHTVEIAKILETKYIRMFSFFIPEGEDPAKYRDEVLERWQKFIEASEGSGLILVHENEKDIYGDTAKRCLDLLQTLNCDRVRAVFDPANFVQCGEVTWPDAYNLLKDYIEYVHVKDAVYSDKSVVPAGHGDGRIYEILKDLYDSGFEGFLSIEPHLGNFVGFATLENNKDISKLPEGGPRLFAVAENALRKLVESIEKC